MMNDIKKHISDINDFFKQHPNYFFYVLLPAIPLILTSSFLIVIMNLLDVKLGLAGMIITLCLSLYALAYLIHAWVQGILTEKEVNRTRIFFSYKTFLLGIFIFLILFAKNHILRLPQILLNGFHPEQITSGISVYYHNQIISGLLIIILTYILYTAVFIIFSILSPYKKSFAETLKISFGNEAKVIFSGLLVAAPVLIIYTIYNTSIVFIHDQFDIVGNKNLYKLIWEILYAPIDLILKPLSILLFLSGAITHYKNSVS